MYAMVSVWQVENGKLADHEQALHQRIVPGVRAVRQGS